MYWRAIRWNVDRTLDCRSLLTKRTSEICSQAPEKRSMARSILQSKPKAYSACGTSRAVLYMSLLSLIFFASISCSIALFSYLFSCQDHLSITTLATPLRWLLYLEDSQLFSVQKIKDQDPLFLAAFPTYRLHRIRPTLGRSRAEDPRPLNWSCSVPFLPLILLQSRRVSLFLEP